MRSQDELVDLEVWRRAKNVLCPAAVKLPRSFENPFDAMVATGLFLGTLVLLCVGMGNLSGIRHPDEAYYLTVILEMERHHDWVVPRVDGMPSFFKPPLLYWMALLLRALFGGSLFVTRLPAAFFAAGSVSIVYLLAREWRERKTALVAAAMLASMVGVQRFGRSAMLESPLMFGAALAVLGAVRARRSKYGLVLTGIGAAVSVLTKWHGVAVVPLVAALGALIATRNWKALFSPGSALGAAVALLGPLPWFLLASRQPGFATDFFAENISRLSETRDAPISLLGIPLYGLPWTPLSFGYLFTLKKERWREPDVTVPVFWLLVVLGFWLLPASAQYTHHAQAGLPAAALLAAWAVDDARVATRLLEKVLAAMMMLAGPALLGVGLLAPGAAGMVSALSAAAAALAAGVLLFKGQALKSAASFAISMALALGATLPRVDARFLEPVAAETLKREPTLESYGSYPGYFEFALGRSVQRLWAPTDVETSLREGRTVIVDTTSLELPASLPLVDVATFERTSPYVGWPELREAMRQRSLAPLRIAMRVVKMKR